MRPQDGSADTVRATTRPPFALESIEHVLLLVQDMDTALKFYENVLGAEIERRLPHYAMAELRAGVSHIDLVDTAASEGRWALPPVVGGRNIDHIALRIGDCDEHALRRHLAAHAVSIVEEREEGDDLSIYIRDPAGNVIELMGLGRSSSDAR